MTDTMLWSWSGWNKENAEATRGRSITPIGRRRAEIMVEMELEWMNATAATTNDSTWSSHGD